MFSAVRRPWSAYAIAAIVCVVGVIAAEGAAGWYERVTLPVLLGPRLVVSDVAAGDRIESRQGLRFPDRVVAIDGMAVDRLPQRFSNESLVRVEVETRTGRRTATFAAKPLPNLAWWVHGAGSIALGVLYVIMAVIAVSASPEGKLARILFAFALLAALFAFSHFDFATGQVLVPCFYVALSMLPGALIMMALRLPRDARVLERASWLEPASLSLGGALAITLVILHANGFSTIILHQIAWVLFDLSLPIAVSIVIARWLRGDAATRTVLRPVVPWVAAGLPLLIAYMASRLGIVLAGASESFFPALATVPLAGSLACVRRDLWGSRAAASRTLRDAAILFTAAGISIGIGAVIASMVGVRAADAIMAASITICVGAAVAFFIAGRHDDSKARRSSLTTAALERLAERLANSSSEREIGSLIEQTVRELVTCDSVSFVAGDADTDTSGHSVLIRNKVRGHPISLLRARKLRGAPFDSREIDVLRIVASQGSLALLFRQRLDTLDMRRRQQAEAWESERAAIIEALAAEIAHEIRYPINFFRSIFSKDSQHHPLDAEEVDIGCEEVERLERLVTGLRRVAVRRLERQRVRVRDVAARAELLLRDRLAGRAFDVDVDADVQVRCDPDQITQVLVNLMSNAVSATKRGGGIGVRWTPVRDGAELTVWDGGEGFVGPASAIFTPWFTTKTTGTGLGLAITHRIVRAHGWGIDAIREEGLTRLVISIPRGDIATDTDENETEEGIAS